MKKGIIITVIIALLAALTGAFIYMRNTINEKNDEIDKHLVLLDINSFKNKIENKDDFILIITRTDCSHCEAYLPVFKKVLSDYDLTAYQLHQDLLTEDADIGYLKSVATINGTPTVVFIKNGEEENTLNRIVGERQRDYTIKRLKNLGYIKE